MAHDVIMPALGMAQDTGLLVAWRKAPGDPVAVGEVLFEVETDKATMEVEAAAAGFLSAVTAGGGVDVPVGQVIARIVNAQDEVDRTSPKALGAAAPVSGAPAQPAPPPAAVAPPPAVAQPAAPPPAPPQPARQQQPAPPHTPAAPSSSAPSPRPAGAEGRILASPKARVMAAEQGLDLSRLVRAGHPQPYHVADLDRLRNLAPVGRSTLAAKVDATALQTLLKKATDADSARVLAAFAKGAWRQVFDADLSVAVMRPDGQREGEGALLLTDLTGTRLTSYAPPEGLVLTVATEGGAVHLTLTFDEGDLPFASAAAWLNETAARVEDPVRQLI